MAYKKLMDVSMADIKSWDVLLVDVKRVENKKYDNVRYFISFKLPYVEVRDDIKSSKYYSILLVHRKKENINLIGLEVPYRIIKGKTKDGLDFYQVQLKFADNCSFTHMLSQADSHNLLMSYELQGKMLVVVDKPEDIEEKFNDDDMPDVVK